MSVDPVWWLFRIQPQDSDKVKTAFDEAVKRSQIAQKLEAYLQQRSTRIHLPNPLFQEEDPEATERADEFDEEDLYNSIELFYP